MVTKPRRTRLSPGRELPSLVRQFVVLLATFSMFAPLTNELYAAPGDSTRHASLPKSYLEIDGIAGVVGKEIITVSELVRAQGKQTASQSMVPTSGQRPRSEVAMLRQTLKTLIENKLVEKSARMMGLKISDAEVDKTLSDLRERNLWDIDELRTAVKQLGFSSLAQYRDHIRTEKLRIKMLRVKLGSRLRVTEKEVSRILDVKYKGGTQEEEVRSRHILVKLPADASPLVVNGLRKKAWNIYDMVAAGKEDFSSLAEKHSDDLGTEQGGDLGYMRRWMLDPTFASNLWNLQPGQISKVIQTPFGFHIIKMVAKRMVPVKNAKVLEQMVRSRLTERQFLRLYQAWMSEMKATTHIEIRL
jgi:peptidyl-prolyl cis-trans isomerase SurA